MSVLDAVRGVHSGTDWTATAPGARYAVVASRVDDRPDQAVHTGHTLWVEAVCAVHLDGRPVMASASDDGTVRFSHAELPMNTSRSRR